MGKTEYMVTKKKIGRSYREDRVVGNNATTYEMYLVYKAWWDVNIGKYGW
jgi:hypothetical protein